MRVNGSTTGIKNSILESLDGIYDITLPAGRLWTKELVDSLALHSGAINREIAVYIDRKGHVTDVTVGDFKTVDLNGVEGKRNDERLSGIRCIHTHPGGSGQLSPVDISTLKLLRLDMIAAVGVYEKRPSDIYAAVPSPENGEDAVIFGPLSGETEDFKELIDHISDADEALKKRSGFTDRDTEKAVLVGLRTGETRIIQGVSEADVSIAELRELADTAGATVVAELIQNKASRDPAFMVGKGKIEEIRLIAQAENADLVIFDEDITPSQQRNIEEVLGVKVLDRTALILDIFAQRARSREGKIQVELAQLEYILPRLSGQGVALSRLGGGIGTRGPGETKLETDRRHIRRKIDYLKDQLREIRKQRGILRVERTKNRVPTVSLVGYTNAGKSSLLNALCDADAYAENKLFATLDTTTRRLNLDDQSYALLTDTVGFIRKLPHNLLDAFKSTLEETVFSDAVVIVADTSDPFVSNQIDIVDGILGELGVTGKPTVIALNKIDKAGEHHRPLSSDRDIIETSALTHEGLDKLKIALKGMLFGTKERYRLRVPFSEGNVLSSLYEAGKVLSTDYDESATVIDIELDRETADRFSSYRLTLPAMNDGDS